MRATGTAQVTLFDDPISANAPIFIGRRAYVPRVRTSSGTMFDVRFRPGPLRLEAHTPAQVHFELRGSDLRERFGTGTEFDILSADAKIIGRGRVVVANVYESSLLWDNLARAILGSLGAIVLIASYRLWGNTGALIAALLFVVGPVAALTVVALRHAKSNGPNT